MIFVNKLKNTDLFETSCEKLRNNAYNILKLQVLLIQKQLLKANEFK